MQHWELSSVHTLKPGMHLYQFYHEAQDYFEILTAYFRAGLIQDEACLWLVPDSFGVAKAYEMMKSVVMDLDIYRDRGSFKILSANDWYLTQGRFDEEKSMQNAAQAVAAAKALGHKVVRGAGDAGVIPHQDEARLHEYEKKMADWIPTQSVIGLCTYPLSRCTLAETKHVVEVHDDVLIGRV